MMPCGLRLYKKQRLCSPTAIEALFARTPDVDSALAYPLRAVWRHGSTRRSDSPLAFVIVVPKRRLRHAVDRVLMRRRIREAFRLNHAAFALPEGARTDVAFVYVASGLEPYAAVERAVTRLLGRLAASATDQSPCQQA
ncbi:MAG: ribonuclease P protein component [Muribaculaceae bacterium]|nr:ribonuclease P protein component [Muribaculaceae bacterium]